MADKLDSKVKVQVIKDDIEKAEKAPLEIPTSDIADPVQAYLPISRFLNVGDIYDAENIKKLEVVAKFLSNKASEGDKLKALAAIERKLGTPRIGETRLGRVYNFARAQETLEEARSMRDAYFDG